MNEEPEREALAEWAGLYVSGVLLVVFVAAHLVAVHYAGAQDSDGYSFRESSMRMSVPIYQFWALGLLSLALFHGLLGTHRVIVDLEICGPKAMSVVRVVLLAFGIGGFAYGVLIFIALATGA